MPRWVLLLHRLPGDGFGRALEHHDWLIEPAAGAGGLMSFRIPAESVERVEGIGPGQVGCHGFTARRLADHRAVYLEYEGQVSGGRGSVRRVLAGDHRGLTEHGGRMEIEMRVGGGEGGWARWEGERGEGGEIWQFRLQAGVSSERMEDESGWA